MRILRIRPSYNAHMFLQVSQLQVRYAGQAVAAVQDVSLGLAAGQIGVLIGPSGCGKTTLLRSVAGLESVAAGGIRLGSQVVGSPGHSMPPEQRRIGMVFQDYALFPHLTVRQNIGFGLQRGWRNPRPRVRHPEVDQWLEALHIEPLAEQMPHQLSGGQRQRVALARALAAQPGALLLDEPFSALDPALRQALRDELDSLQRRLQLPMILITHDPEDARQLGDHIIHLQDGQVLREELAGAPGARQIRPERASASSGVPHVRSALPVAT